MQSLLARASLSLAACFCWTALSIGCDSDDPPKDGDKDSGSDEGPGQNVTALRGVVKRAGGGPLASVKVSAGSVTATTDASGRYELRAPAGERRLRFELAGHVDGFRTAVLLDGKPTQLDIALLPLAEPMKFDASSGGTAVGRRGAGVKAPENAFSDASGAAVTGMVDLYLTPLDPSSDEEIAAAPEFVAERDGSPQLLESMGLLDIQVRKGDEKLSIAPGKTLELSIPVPAGSSPQPTMDFWSFDEDKSVWVHEGEATYDEATKTYVGRASHMSLWNVDQVYTATCVCGVVEEKTGDPLPGARIDANGVSYFGSTSSQSDEDGKFCIAVRKDSDVDIAAYHGSGGGQSRRVKSGSGDTLVPPRVGAAGCLDAGTWEVTKDRWTGSDGESKSCSEIDNPFGDSCASDLFEVFGGCYKPEGACTISLSGAQTKTRYANGSYSEGGVDGSSYYSSSGKLCASASYDLSNTESIRIEYMIPGKGSYAMEVGAGGTGDYVIECPGGRETRITAAQQQALEACSMPQASGGQATECTIEGLPGGDAGIPGTCTTNSNCMGDAICCIIPDSSLGICIDQMTCDLIRMQN